MGALYLSMFRNPAEIAVLAVRMVQICVLSPENVIVPQRKYGLSSDDILQCYNPRMAQVDTSASG